MAFLSEVNPYLKDPQKRAKIILRQVVDSSAFEGIQGLTQGDRLSAAAMAEKE